MPPLLGFDDQIIFAVIDEHKLSSDKQHAFRKWHSCETQLTTVRALTRILKTGVQDSHLAKSRSPTGKIGSPTPKKLESHQFVHTVYLFYFSRK